MTQSAVEEAQVNKAGRVRGLATPLAFDFGAQGQHIAEASHVESAVLGQAATAGHQLGVGHLGHFLGQLEFAYQYLERQVTLRRVLRCAAAFNVGGQIAFQG